MKATFPTILNASLPPSFRSIRLELAREPDHPTGDAGVAYVVLAPLDPNGKIDAELWRRHREACRVARLRPGKDQDTGHLLHLPGGSWAFHYDGNGEIADEKGYHFSDEQFVPGEYVSLREGDVMRTFKVAAVTRL